MVEDNFHLLHRSVRHALPNLENTLKVLLIHLEEHRAHERVGRETQHSTPDYYANGMELLQSDKSSGLEDNDDIAAELELDDIIDL